MIKGKMLIKYDDGNGNLVEKILEPGDVSHYPPGAIHQEEALEDCYIIEASTITLMTELGVKNSTMLNT